MMSRRAILMTGAGLLVLGAGGYALSSAGEAERYRAYAERLRAPLASGDVSELVRYAVLAANGHNTQPWLFRTAKGKINILPDFSRRTPVVDPDDHHLFVSLGCAAANLELAAAASGFQAAIARSAAAGEGVTVELAMPVGQGALDGVAKAMFDAIPLRQSTRSDYDGRPVPVEDIALMVEAAKTDKVDLSIMTEKADLARIRDLVVAGNDRQMKDAAFLRELKQWLRFSASSAERHGDGLYSAASGNPAVPEWIGPLAFDLVVRPAGENAKYARQMQSSAGVAIFAAEKDEPDGWIAVGQACQRFCLMATALGIRTAFVNQPVEVVALRGEMAALAGLGSRRPDLVLRFGYAPALPQSPRRPVAAVIAA